MRDRALPSVRGPIDFRALARFAASIASLTVGRLRKDNAGVPLPGPASRGRPQRYHCSLQSAICKIQNALYNLYVQPILDV
jgi:hypothetical protein